MKSVFIVALLIVTVVVAALPAQAEDKPIQISLFSPVQIFAPDQSTPVCGSAFSAAGMPT